MGKVAERLGRPLMPWQQELVDIAYEYDPATDLFRYNELDTTVPRQSGKTTITLAKKVHRLTVMARQLGPQRSTYTAQTRLAARKKLERDFAELLRGSRSFREVPNAKARPSAATEWRLSLNNGSEAIQFGSGSFLQIDAPSRTGGHGDTLDDGTVDEAFAHEDDTVEAAMRPAMATRKNAQLWVISTAGDGRSKYLWRKVLAGRAATDAGRHGRVCYIEYSAPEDADPGDPATWWSCMPALGITINEDFIRGEWERAQRKGREGIDTFRRAYLNQWPEIPILDDGTGGTITKAAWQDQEDLASAPSDPVGVCFSVAVSQDRSWACIASSGRRADGASHVELVDNRRGTGWITDRILELRDKWQPCAVVVNPAGPEGSLIADMSDAGIDVVQPSARDLGQAFGMFFDGVMVEKTLWHRPDGVLARSAEAASSRQLGDAKTWDQRGATDISPIVAATNAVWGFETHGDNRAPNIW